MIMNLAPLPSAGGFFFDLPSAGSPLWCQQAHCSTVTASPSWQRGPAGYPGSCCREDGAGDRPSGEIGRAGTMWSAHTEVARCTSQCGCGETQEGDVVREAACGALRNASCDERRDVFCHEEDDTLSDEASGEEKDVTCNTFARCVASAQRCNLCGRSMWLQHMPLRRKPAGSAMGGAGQMDDTCVPVRTLRSITGHHDERANQTGMDRTTRCRGQDRGRARVQLAASVVVRMFEIGDGTCGGCGVSPWRELRRGGRGYCVSDRVLCPMPACP